jgi:hypothetical protein
MNWLTIILLICSIVSLALFLFIIRFAARTEIMLTNALFALLITVGLFSWAMMASSSEHDQVYLWYNLAYLCAILMFPLLTYMFVQRSGSTSFLVTTMKGMAALFSPLAAQLFLHYLLSEEQARFSDFVFLMVWLVVILVVWMRLYARMQETSSKIKRTQMEFMLSSFFVVVLYNLMLIFNLLAQSQADTANFSLLYGVAVLIALVVSSYGLLRYQLLISVDFLMRNFLIVLITSLICAVFFVLGNLTILSFMAPLESNFLIVLSTVLVIFLVLLFGTITSMATNVVERISPALKWQESNAQEIFVLHSKGLLVAHAGHAEAIGEVDKDMIGGMLTAIQNFVQEAFQASDMDTLKSLNMGRLKMLIEAKGHVVVAVLITGHEAKELRKSVRRLAEELDLRFGGMLDGWQGEKSVVREVQEWVEKIWLSMIVYDKSKN